MELKYHILFYFLLMIYCSAGVEYKRGDNGGFVAMKKRAGGGKVQRRMKSPGGGGIISEERGPGGLDIGGNDHMRRGGGIVSSEHGTGIGGNDHMRRGGGIVSSEHGTGIGGNDHMRQGGIVSEERGPDGNDRLPGPGDYPSRWDRPRNSLMQPIFYFGHSKYR